jgi:hypothetical protein
MSLSAATTQRALDVPATPTSALPTAALGNAERVLTDAPLGTQKPAAGFLALIAGDLGRLDLFDQYMQQLYAAPAKSAKAVTSFEHLRDVLSGYASVSRLVLVGHGLANEFKVGTRQLTHTQFAAEFAGKVPPIGELCFDGCMMGGNPAGLREIALSLGCSIVRAWSFFHVLDWWRMTPTGDVNAASAQFLPLAARAAPYLPKSLDGKSTYSDLEQDALFRTSSLNLAGEYFIELEVHAAGKSFIASVTNSLLDPAQHRPRSSAESRLVDSLDTQSALEIELASFRPLLARVSVTPWK